LFGVNVVNVILMLKMFLINFITILVNFF